MPTRPSPGLPDSTLPRLATVSSSSTPESRAERAEKVRLRRALSLLLLTLLVPGSAQLLAGNKRIGRIAIRIWLAVLGTLLVALCLGLLWHGSAFWAASNTKLLGLVWLLLCGAAIGWALLFIDAWRLGNPLSLHQRHRLAVVGLNGLLTFTVAGTLLFGAHLVSVQRDFMISLFGDGTATAAHDGRYNVLLMGGDSGDDRWGLRPDSMTVASIDAETGESVLISLPRNMEDFPFAKGSVMDEQFPQGFDCDGCYLNGVSTWAQDNEELFGKSKNPGVDATIMAIEGITGLKINYWAMVNMEGFSRLVDAVGGVELNVRDRIPVGGLGDDVTGYIEPGKRTLDGNDTLWFARAREGSDDYSRMARQKCVMSAMLSQVSPQTALTNFREIAKASSDMVSTDLPRSEVNTFLDLALKAKDEKITTLSLVPPLVNTAEPDIAKIQRKVTETIDRSEGEAPAKKAKRNKRPDGMTGGSLGNRDEGYAANQSDDLTASC